MSKINELRNQRAKAWDEAKKFLDSHRSEKDILSAEDTAAYEKMEQEIVDKVAQCIRLNRTKLKSMQDTSTVYEELTNSIQAGYFIKLLGLPFSMAVCAEVSKKSFASAVVPYQFPFLQMGLFLLVLFGMEVVLSVWMVRRQKKPSLAEQMRAQG